MTTKPDNQTDNQSADNTSGAGSGGAQDNKMVPERDLMAIKARAEGLEKALAQATTDLETWKKNASEAQDNLRRKEAELASASSSSGNLEVLTSERDALRAQLTATEQRLGEATNALLTNQKATISKLYGIPDSALDGKSAEDLKLMQETLELVKAQPSRFDSGSGSGAPPPSSPRAKIIAGLEQQFGRG